VWCQPFVGHGGSATCDRRRETKGTPSKKEAPKATKTERAKEKKDKGGKNRQSQRVLFLTRKPNRGLQKRKGRAHFNAADRHFFG
jgi:hypothetical protein